MSEFTKLILALQQIDSLLEIVSGNEYESFLCSHLLLVSYELRRQLTNLHFSDKVYQSLNQNKRG